MSEDHPRATLPTSTNRELDAETQVWELTKDELDAPWAWRRFYATLASSLRKWVGW